MGGGARLAAALVRALRERSESELACRSSVQRSLGSGSRYGNYGPHQFDPRRTKPPECGKFAASALDP